MADNTGKETKDTGAVQGTDANPELNLQEPVQTGELTVEVEAPKWAVELVDICSKVLEAVAQFNENAANVVKDIIAEAKAVGGTSKEDLTKVQATADVKINKKAKYVVAPGRAFHSSVSGGVVGEGVDVSGLEPDRLKALISQGIAVEASED